MVSEQEARTEQSASVVEHSSGTQLLPLIFPSPINPDGQRQMKPSISSTELIQEVFLAQSAIVEHLSAIQPLPFILSSPIKPVEHAHMNRSLSVESMHVAPATQSASPLEQAAVQKFIVYSAYIVVLQRYDLTFRYSVVNLGIYQ